MSRSIRASLFLMVAPFAVTFTLVAWVVDSKIGPWLDRPLLLNCTERGFAPWICNVQDGLLGWIALGLGMLVLLSVTALLSLSLFRTHLRNLQQDVMDFQKGHRSQLTDAPREMHPLVQLLNRILQSALKDPAGATSSHDERPKPQPGVSAPAPDLTVAPSQPPEPAPPPSPEPAARRNPEPARTPRPVLPPEGHQPRTAEPAPEPAPRTQPDERDLEVSLRELDADLEQALAEAEEAIPEPEPKPDPRKTTQPEQGSATGNQPVDRPGPPHGTRAQPAEPAKPTPRKNESFPARKCRKLIAILGHRYPDVNFELITDVTEDVPWSIREAELTEVFGELLDNAGKWAASQVNIFLAIKGNMLVFGVADDGPGLDPELASHLGEEDFRAKPDQAPGRGLPAVRRVIDSHGGSLAFDRSRLGGLEAIAALPGAPVPRHARAPGFHH
ncbi:MULTISPECIES: ATP-binding protein [Marinobacter]|uniref:histidine kinase n=1 Tax=Marinobacter segnicrescens TaxID=430453 RepID=A0A1I0CH50_9GAMM|nr:MULTISPECIES: ATP-binding protein [Marinobacter]UZD64997.1 ATP-binding protein [Marinobacter sp. AN1]SET18939.1 Histidine kinase-, DNA gyrase B-, and HSP90-like ATPase [Marinobacter segnicrescens]